MPVGNLERGNDRSILVVANRLPHPLDDGWKRRTFHVVRGLARVGPVTFASLHGGPPEDVDALVRSLGGRVDVITAPPAPLSTPLAALLGAATARPYHVWRQRSLAFRRLIAQAAAKQSYDVGVATLTHLYSYLDVLGPQARRIVDTHNIDSLVLDRYAASLGGPRAVYARMTARKLRRHEARVFKSADRIMICSDQEVAQVSEIAPDAEPLVIPNGVDSRHTFVPLETPPAVNRIVFFGKLDYYPNSDAVLHFVRDVLPGIQREIPDIEFQVVGPGPGPELLDLGRTNHSVTITGRVHDVTEAVGTAAVVVVPLRMGGGTRLKILEALALARPVVSTRIGAEGLDLEPGRDLVVTDEPVDMVRQIVRLIRDPEAGAALGATGRETVRRLYDWTVIEGQIEGIVSSLAAGAH